MTIQDWLAAKGFTMAFVADGAIHRAARYGHRSKSAWYIAWTEPFPLCVAGDWRTGERWEFRGDRDMTPQDRRRALRMMQAAQAAAEKARAARQEQVALQAHIMLQTASPADNHPYLVRKGISPHGAVQQDGALLIPMQDIRGRLWGLQRILPDGRKFFLPEQRAAGCLFAIGQVGPTIFICEGFATGASIYAATGAPVVCAFFASNLLRVAAAVACYYPRSSITLAADNDTETPGNPGVTAATNAARALGLKLAIPQFAAGTKGSDFNDLISSFGKSETRRQLEAAIEFPREKTKEWSTKYFQLMSEV